MLAHSRFLFVVGLSFLLPLSLAAQAPTITAGGTVNAADYSRDFAPGSIISIFGTNLVATSAGAITIPLPTSLSGTNVELINGTNVQSLPLFYVGSGQINTQLPYGLSAGQVQIRVRSSIGVSGTDSLTIVPRAPKIFTLDFTGTGSAVVTNPTRTVASQTNPVKPGDDIIIWMNSLGETTPAVVAGASAPTATPARITDPVTVTIGGVPLVVAFAGAAPGFSGLYQINVKAPFQSITGPLDLIVTIGTARTQTSINVPYRQLGFYNALLGGKPVSGQTITGVNSVSIRQSDQFTWGSLGLNTWLHPGTPSPIDNSVAGEAVTFRNGATSVYDNNGIEDRSGANWYINTSGPDSAKPGLAQIFTMSNYFPLVAASYIRLAQSTTVTEMIGYFDGNGSPNLPFDPNNPYIKYRMNIWSNTSGNPKETTNFVGDIFSTDSVAGTFTVSATGMSRISSTETAPSEAIWRLSFKPNSAVTLPAGEYWFSHDASIRDTPSAGGTSTSASVTVSELSGIIRMQPQRGEKVHFSFFGQEMLYEPSWALPFAVEVHPDSAVSVMN